MPRPKQRTPELRAHVLEVALALLANEGAAGFTTRKVARGADTSPPAVYELFGDKSGLVREMSFEGFRILRHRLDLLEPTDDPFEDLVRLIKAFRSFARDNPVLAGLMFSRPFADFDPGPIELEAGGAVRELIVGRVRRSVDMDILNGDATDVAHVLLAVAQGLAGQEIAGWLGTTKQSRDRRWELAIRATLYGLRPTSLESS